MVIEELFTKLGFQVDPKGIDKAKSSLSGLKKWIGGLALGAGLVSLAKTGIEAAMTMEGLTAQFTVMTGSAEKAEGVIREIADFAAKTPFDKLGLSNAAKTLMAFGMEADKVVPTLKMLGDVAGSDQNKLNSLALVFGQIQSAGRLTGGDLLQLINQGFNPLNTLAKISGKSMAELKDAMSEGKISAEMVTLAFQAATSEGGLFFGNLEAQSQTLQGRISTLKDNFVTALQNMAEAFLPLMKAGVDILIAFDWTPIVATIQSVASGIGALIENMGLLITWLKRLSPLLVLIFGPKLIAMITTAISSTRLYAGALTFVQRAHLAAGSAANYQLTAMGLLKSAMFSATTAAKTFGKAMKSAMVAALNPINILLVGLTAIKELYDYFVGEDAKAEIKASFDEIDFEEFMAGGPWNKGGPEGAMGWEEKLYEMQKKKYEDMLLGIKPATEKEKAEAAEDYKQSKEHYEKYLAMYKRARGIEWTTYKAKTAKPGTAAGSTSSPAMSGGAADFKKMFEDLQKAVDENSKSTRKQTRATEENTRAQKQFDITALSRQAFDAAFNVKLRELTLGTV